ncbi:Rha family transcriptional regulator [Clostridium botulinum]|uniref:Rha family transcriptional regulator n=1 Tax=Clostridium botulinum TaxID=1491 RepID=UPI00096E98A0|nr:Rha family transcriptional regulator [Clostridium botulinum]
MNKLAKKANLTLDSREVADMVDKQHKNLLADIRKYEEFLTSSKVSSLDFFMKNTYQDVKGEQRPNYQITKKGCEFIAHKLTGQKGTLFTATYINRFHEMESTIKQQQTKITSLTKQQEIEARLKNAKVREANIYLKIADKIQIPEYKQIMYSKATEVLSGEQLLPLPKAERKTFSAAEIGKKLGITSNMVGRLANKNNLKTNEYGINVWDKAKHSDKQVPTFRYYENVIPVFREILKAV